MAEMNQAAWRRDRNIRDNWGRLWLVSFETKPDGSGSNMPTGQIIAAGWTDPLATPQQYLQIPMGEFGEPDRNKLVCRHDLWLPKQKEAEMEWRKALYAKGQQHYKSAFNPKTAEEDDFLMSVQGVGPKPWPPSEAIIRAMKGDKAMLGLAPLSKADRILLGQETAADLGYAEEPTVAERNPALENQVGKPDKILPYFSFVKKMKEAGTTDPAEIKEHWKIYRESFSETD